MIVVNLSIERIYYSIEFIIKDKIWLWKIFFKAKGMLCNVKWI